MRKVLDSYQRAILVHFDNKAKIKVFTTMKKFGLPIEVIRNARQCPNFYGLILVD
jgi:hypothetical protein